MIDAVELEAAIGGSEPDLLAAAAGVIREAVRTGSPPQSPAAAAVAETVAGLPLDGAFVSLHAGERLRACRGYLGGGQRLGRILVDAAAAACRDRRFKPLRAEELDGLELGVSLLYDWRTPSCPPPERPAIIATGNQGCQVRAGPDQGLLLPAVARRHGWNAEEFLDATCRKAGLPVGAWRRGDVEFETFRAMELSAPLGDL